MLEFIDLLLKCPPIISLARLACENPCPQDLASQVVPLFSTVWGMGLCLVLSRRDQAPGKKALLVEQVRRDSGPSICFVRGGGIESDTSPLLPHR